MTPSPSPRKTTNGILIPPKRAFGRFGIRILDPVVMTQPHWHGHSEANFACHFEMEYVVDGQTLMLPANRLVVFWRVCRIS
jgi:hypothetical protein